MAFNDFNVKYQLSYKFSLKANSSNGFPHIFMLWIQLSETKNGWNRILIHFGAFFSPPFPQVLAIEVNGMSPPTF